MSQDKSFFEFIQHGIAGSIGAGLSTMLIFPVENVKLRMQIDAKRQEKSMSMKQKVVKVFKQEGLTGFYKGITSTVIGNLISNFTYFLCYNYLKYLCQDFTQVTDSIRYIICTFIAGITTSIVTNPFWVIQSAQTNSKKEISILQTVKMLGFKKLFKGLSVSFVLVLNPIINYFIYEKVKIYAILYKGTKYESIIYFLSGGLGKFFATIVTYPYQLIRTQSHLTSETSIIKMAQHVVKNQGFLGLFGGLQAKIFSSVMNTAFTLMFYENIFQFLLSIFNHLDETSTVFGLKLFAIGVICIYVTSQQIQFSKMYYLFFIGFVLSISGNLIYLLNHKEYQTISLGLFAIGILFYIHSMVSNLSRSKKKNRHAMVYIVISIVIIVLLALEKYIEIYENQEIHLKDIISGGLIFTLIVLSIMRYSKTSTQSYYSTVIGVIFLGISARLMYMDQKNDYNLKQSSIYILCIVQVLAMILLITGTVSHRKYIINSRPQKSISRKSSSERPSRKTSSEQNNSKNGITLDNDDQIKQKKQN